MPCTTIYRHVYYQALYLPNEALHSQYFYIEICTSAVFAYILNYTRLPFLDMRTELVETQREIIIYRNGISIISLPLLCMTQSWES